MAALATSLSNILSTEYALSDDTIKKQLLDRLVSDDALAIVELQGHLHEKQSAFTILDVSFLADAIRQHREATDSMVLAKAGLTPQIISIPAGELEKKEWDLVLEKLNHDKKQVEIHQCKCEDLRTQQFHVKREHARKRHVLGRTAANAFIGHRMKYCVMDTLMQANKELDNAINDMANKHALQPKQILCIAWANFSAPQLYNATEQKLVAEITGLCLNRVPPGIGLVFMPVHASKSGTLWKLEHSVHERLASNNINVDRNFVLCYSHRPDARH